MGTITLITYLSIQRFMNREIINTQIKHEQVYLISLREISQNYNYIDDKT